MYKAPIAQTTPAQTTAMANPQTPNGPLEVFISYSHKDEALKDELYIHLANLTRQGKIQPWQDRAIEAGTEWDAEIKARLESARIILLLITPRFIASEYCFDQEMERAMERHAEGTARVIPIIMKPCDWAGTAFSKLQILPKDAKPVTAWNDQDEALLNVVQGIRRATESLQRQSAESAPDVAGSQPATQPTPSTAPSTASSNPIQKRLTLFKLLSSLPGPQFEQVVFALSPPAGNVPPNSAPQGQRVPALLTWAESPIGCGLETLEQVLNSLLP